MAAVDISAVQHCLQVTDQTGKRFLFPVDLFGLLISNDKIAIRFGDDNILAYINGLTFADLSVSGVNCVSTNDFITKIGALINF